MELMIESSKILASKPLAGLGRVVLCGRSSSRLEVQLGRRGKAWTARDRGSESRRRGARGDAAVAATCTGSVARTPPAAVAATLGRGG